MELICPLHQSISFDFLQVYITLHLFYILVHFLTVFIYCICTLLMSITLVHFPPSDMMGDVIWQRRALHPAYNHYTEEQRQHTSSTKLTFISLSAQHTAQLQCKSGNKGIYIIHLILGNKLAVQTVVTEQIWGLSCLMTPSLSKDIRCHV